MSTKSSNSSRNSINNDDVEKLKDNAPKARICHLKKWPHFQGYGFNLHAERSKMGQHIGKVDSDSPAESAGLKEGDRIVEVNYVNISNENHQQVVKRIRNGLESDGTIHEDEVVLLVVDHEADEYFKKLNIIVKSSDADNVIRMVTRSPTLSKKVENNNSIEHQNLNHTTSSSTSISNEQVDKNNNHQSSNTKNPDEQHSNNHSRTSSNSSRTNVSNLNKSEIDTSNNVSNNAPRTIVMSAVDKNEDTKSELNISKNKPAAPVLQSNNSNGTLSNNNRNSIISNTLKDDPYQMSAAEFRNYLKSKGRNDPRIVSVDMKQKHEIFQNM